MTQAERRVWIATRMLSDGSLSTALYFARYRGLQTEVILSKKYSRHFLSQWNILKKNNISVTEADDHFFDRWPAMIVLDQQAWTADIPLIKFHSNRSYQLTLASSEVGRTLISRFRATLNATKSRPQIPEGSGENVAKKANKKDTWKGWQSYRYGKGRQEKPKELPRRLPRVTKWKQNRRINH